MNRAAEPLVSILVPAFNAEETLSDTLRSALASSYPKLELILVDDGSTDATVRIAEAFANEDQRVRLLRQNHGGVSAALNFGLDHVRGDLVARLDSDDLWHPTKLEKQVTLMVADPAIALVYTFVRYIDASGRVVRDAAPQELARRALCQCLYDGIVGGGSSAVFRRSVLDTVERYDERLSVWEDLLLHLHVAAAGEIAFVPEYLTGYRLRGKSSSADRRQSLQSWRLARRSIHADFPQIPAFVHEWSKARRLLELAEGFAIDKRYTTSARLFAECLACDPVRTSTFLRHRLHRRLSGQRRPLQGSGPPFADTDVTTKCCLSDFDGQPEGTRLRSLDNSREQLLRSIDARIPLRPRPRSTAAQETSP
jgi:glycosyltransferase involved in cell wall biosynthesis